MFVDSGRAVFVIRLKKNAAVQGSIPARTRHVICKNLVLNIRDCGTYGPFSQKGTKNGKDILKN